MPSLEKGVNLSENFLYPANYMGDLLNGWDRSPFKGGPDSGPSPLYAEFTLEKGLRLRTLELTKLLLWCALTTPAFGNITFLDAPGTTVDTVSWAQLGADQTLLGQNFSATSALGASFLGSFGTSGGGLTSVVCDPVNPVNCSWATTGAGYATGDTVLWAEDTNFAGSGPITLLFPTEVGGGAYIQANAVGQFSAMLAVYGAGNTLLGTQNYTSDVAGDPLFLGALSDTQNVTQEVFSVIACNGICDPTDFTIGTYSSFAGAASPEPSTWLTVGTFLVFGCAVRKRLGFVKECAFRRYY